MFLKHTLIAQKIASILRVDYFRREERPNMEAHVEIHLYIQSP